MCELCLNCSYSKLLTSSSSSLASRHSVRRRANETPAQSEREGESGQSAMLLLLVFAASRLAHGRRDLCIPVGPSCDLKPFCPLVFRCLLVAS